MRNEMKFGLKMAKEEEFFARFNLVLAKIDTFGEHMNEEEKREFKRKIFARMVEILAYKLR